MNAERPAPGYRFANFELNSTTGELRRNGVRVRLHVQPFQVLQLLVARPGELLTREEIARELWPEGTFVDYEHGVNSAVNRLREALGDKASNPRFVETLARRGYRFVAPVEVIEPVLSTGTEGPSAAVVSPSTEQTVEEHAGWWSQVLARPEDLPASSPTVVLTLFVLLQAMYLGFYVGALANLAEIADLLSPLPLAATLFRLIILSAGVMIPVRVFLICAAMFQAPGMREKFLKLWPALLVMDLLWAMSPFLLLHHINEGLALACIAPLVYAPFAQRSLVLMGVGAVKETERAKG
jgi:cholera toxin transcriptional activator